MYIGPMLAGGGVTMLTVSASGTADPIISVRRRSWIEFDRGSPLCYNNCCV